MDWFLYDNGLRHERVTLSQPVFICLKLTMETSEQCVKSVKVNNKNTRTTSLALF